MWTGGQFVGKHGVGVLGRVFVKVRLDVAYGLVGPASLCDFISELSGIGHRMLFHTMPG